jgi:hypothetical protein
MAIPKHEPVSLLFLPAFDGFANQKEKKNKKS